MWGGEGGSRVMKNKGSVTKSLVVFQLALLGKPLGVSPCPRGLDPDAGFSLQEPLKPPFLLRLSEAHSFLSCWNRRDNEPIQHAAIIKFPPRWSSQRRNWDGNGTTGMENGWPGSQAGSLTLRCTGLVSMFRMQTCRGLTHTHAHTRPNVLILGLLAAPHSSRNTFSARLGTSLSPDWSKRLTVT